MQHASAALVGALLLTWAQVAQSADDKTREAEAAALFDRGLAAMHAEQFEVACSKLAQSYELAPLMGVLLTLAECEAGRGQRAKALRHYRAYLDGCVRLPPQERRRQARRIKAATDQVAALERLVAWITVAVPTPAPPGSVVRHNGVPLKRASWGVALPVEPGMHRIRWEHKGGAETTTHELNKGDRRTIVLQLPNQAKEETVPHEGDSSTPTWSTRHTVALGLAGVGALSLIAGGITGGLALGQKSTINAHCQAAACDSEGKRAGDWAQSLAVASNVSFAVGLTGIVSGAALWLTAPTPRADGASRRAWYPVATLRADRERRLGLGIGGTW